MQRWSETPIGWRRRMLHPLGLPLVAITLPLFGTNLTQCVAHDHLGRDVVHHVTATATDGTPWFIGYVPAILVGLVVLWAVAQWRRFTAVARHAEATLSVERSPEENTTITGRLRLTPSGSRVSTVVLHGQGFDRDGTTPSRWQPGEDPEGAVLEVGDDRIPLEGQLVVAKGTRHRWAEALLPVDPHVVQLLEREPERVELRSIDDGEEVVVDGVVRGEQHGSYRVVEEQRAMGEQIVLRATADAKHDIPLPLALRRAILGSVVAFCITAALGYDAMLLQNQVYSCRKCVGDCTITAVDERHCVATDEACARTAACLHSGTCAAVSGRCAASKPEHCTQTPSCRRDGRWCELVDGQCVTERSGRRRK